jgi:predicted transcriptional regulator
MKKKTLKDFLIALSEFPHMPEWGTLREAVAQLNLSYETGYQTVLVFSGANRLVGMLTQEDVLRGVEPHFTEHRETGAAVFRDDPVEGGGKSRLLTPIGEIMSPAKAIGRAGDSVFQGVHLMMAQGLSLLPVSSEAGTVIGVVRMDDLFHEITNRVLRL